MKENNSKINQIIEKNNNNYEPSENDKTMGATLKEIADKEQQIEIHGNKFKFFRGNLCNHCSVNDCEKMRYIVHTTMFGDLNSTLLNNIPNIPPQKIKLSDGFFLAETVSFTNDFYVNKAIIKTDPAKSGEFSEYIIGIPLEILKFCKYQNFVHYIYDENNDISGVKQRPTLEIRIKNNFEEILKKIKEELDLKKMTEKQKDNLEKIAEDQSTTLEKIIEDRQMKLDLLANLFRKMKKKNLIEIDGSCILHLTFDRDYALALIDKDTFISYKKENGEYNVYKEHKLNLDKKKYYDEIHHPIMSPDGLIIYKDQSKAKIIVINEGNVVGENAGGICGSTLNIPDSDFYNLLLGRIEQLDRKDLNKAAKYFNKEKDYKTLNKKKKKYFDKCVKKEQEKEKEQSKTNNVKTSLDKKKNCIII